jgi:uncharacterized protein (DUF2252 family)
VGLRDYIVLLEGNGSQDPLFLQIKQEAPSIYSKYVAGPRFPNEGMRVAVGQRKMQPLSDLLLGWTKIGEHDFLVRHLNDHKGSIEMENLPGAGLNELAVIAGELLARGHSRSGDCHSICGYIGSPKKTCASLTAFAVAYATQAQEDYDRFCEAIKKKQIRPAKNF